MKTTYLKLYAQNGRIIIANSAELNKMLPDKKQYIIIAPVIFYEKDVQIREIDSEEMKTLTPNSMLSSPYEPFFDEYKKPEYCLNSKPFFVKKLQKAINKLKKLSFYELFGV
jgi:hypothetical protein